MTKTPSHLPANRHLFIVRVWREDGQPELGGQWRGSIEHVPSGQRIHFVSLATLTEFMQAYMSAALPTLPDEGSNHDE